MNKINLQIEQLESKIKAFAPASKITIPPTGWIKAVRLTLGMTLQQLAIKMNITKQSVREMELREPNNAVSLKSLREAANALEMEFVYGFVPKDGTLEALIERKAKELALKIVSRTSHSMSLEDQENSKERLKKAIEERTEQLKQNKPKILWD